MNWQTLKTHCKSGHPFNAENTYIDRRTGKRSCIECGRIRSREHQRRKRAQAPDQLEWTRDLDLYNRSALSRFNASYEVDALTDCWLWTAGINGSGYGNFWYLGTTVSAHQAAYGLLVSDIPSELHLDHLCRVRRCVNPGHLEPVTPRENILRGEGAAAVNAVKTHCLRGHELTPENLVPSALRTGKRNCATCQPHYKSPKFARTKYRGSTGAANTSPSPSTDSARSQP